MCSHDPDVLVSNNTQDNCEGRRRMTKSVATFWLACVIILLTEPAGALRMWDTILNQFQLHKMARVLESHKLTGLFEDENITVFLATSEAFFTFQANARWCAVDSDDPKQLEKIIVYASVDGLYLQSDLPSSSTAILPSRLGPGLPIYFNTFKTQKGEMLIINGAQLVQPDIRTDNGVIHIIDRVLAPVANWATIATYVETPTLPHLSFMSIFHARSVVPALTLESNRTDKLFTSFSPNDSYITIMPEYGQLPLFENTDLLTMVYMAHVVDGNSVFIPDGLPIEEISALQGTIKFSRRNSHTYVSNGRVRARVVQANIPLVNGVLHVIDNLLYYIYRDVMQMVESLPEARKFYQLIKQLPDITKSVLKDGNQNLTLFIPTDLAFTKIPTCGKNRLAMEQEVLLKVMTAHIVVGMTLDTDSLQVSRSLKALSGDVILVSQVKRDTFIECGGVRAKVEVPDLGTTNGIVHLIDSVLLLNNFTIWEAISYLPLLRQVQELTQNFDDIVDMLSSSESRLTVFLSNDAAMTHASDHVISLLQASRETVYDALRGHMTYGIINIQHLDAPVEIVTLAGTSLRLFHDDDTMDLFVSGSHVTARVTEMDIWCSNGVVYVIDEVLHLPVRTIFQELKRHPNLSYMCTLFESLRNNEFNLSDTQRDLTVFVAANEAFSYLPWPSVDLLMRDLDRTYMILRAHVVPDEKRYLNEISDGTGLPAFQNVIYLLTVNNKRYVINNNVRAEVLTSDIPAVNGRLHIIRHLLYIPYNSVMQLLQSMDETRPFHALMSVNDDYMATVTSLDRNVTLFIPSARYLRTVTSEQMAMMSADPKILKRLFQGHTLPQVRMDDVFLRQYPKENYIESKSSYNMSFTVQKTKNGVFVDGGYDIQILDVIGKAFGCTNGIIYIIDGFLNYSPLTILERLKREPSVSRSLQHMLRLPSPNQVELLNQQNLTFTFLMPHDLAVDFLSYADLSYLHDMQDENRQKVFWRHALNGSEITYDDLRQGRVNSFLLPPEVTFSKLGTGLYFRYHGINSRVTRWNLVACNGIIHLLTHFLYRSPSSSTTYYPADTPTSRTDPVHAVGANKLKLGGVKMLCEILLVSCFGRLAFLVIST
ncbi:fasciclin-1-like isoform X2 [Pomacea canaliculata]|uniref:fasciclin-1-like isoform X2 n=1 Tax=Pomacea canaliculata TaxID=400727 RepID=UPI000D7374B0|nr:fasciclin-1-like isoform X2 [Pomacea canaliculata]